MRPDDPSIDLPTQLLRLRHTRRALDRLSGEARMVAVAGRNARDRIAQLKADVELHERAALLLTTLGEERQAQAQQQIEHLVTKALQTIFSRDLSFHLQPGVRNKTPVVDFIVSSTLDDGTVVDTDVMDARGGGLAATVGFLLRLVVLLLSARPGNTLMVLDETFAHLSAEFEPRVAEFLRELVDRTNIQIVMVTHSDAFTDLADIQHRFTLIDGVTQVQTAR